MRERRRKYYYYTPGQQIRFSMVQVDDAGDRCGVNKLGGFVGASAGGASSDPVVMLNPN